MSMPRVVDPPYSRDVRKIRKTWDRGSVPGLGRRAMSGSQPRSMSTKRTAVDPHHHVVLVRVSSALEEVEEQVLWAGVDVSRVNATEPCQHTSIRRRYSRVAHLTDESQKS
jgi:hypothetical protein